VGFTDKLTTAGSSACSVYGKLQVIAACCVVYPFQCRAPGRHQSVAAAALGFNQVAGCKLFCLTTTLTAILYLASCCQPSKPRQLLLTQEEQDGRWRTPSIPQQENMAPRCDARMASYISSQPTIWLFVAATQDEHHIAVLLHAAWGTPAASLLRALHLPSAAHLPACLLAHDAACIQVSTISCCPARVICFIHVSAS
jgi:hypothetical protein